MKRYHKNLWENTVFGFTISVLFGIFCMILSSIVFSALSLFLMQSMQFVNFLTVVSLMIGGYFSGFICGRYRRKHGFIDGAVCGIIIYILLISGGMICSVFPLKEKLLLLMIAGAVGGVVGVNSKRPEKLM
ncbi:MAG: TIGR04086 family membrane protein [Ruminococcus sp.]|nr:TIGR04086 family membrane protein [Ruminococcus sp.]